MGWRLPTAAELMSLMDPTVASGGELELQPRLPVGHPFAVGGTFGGVQRGWYWTASTRDTALLPRNSNLGPTAMAVKFFPTLEGGELIFSSFWQLEFQDQLHYWCVRGGETH
jgi:hypothetical protein